jgi:hypothetical protein
MSAARNQGPTKVQIIVAEINGRIPKPMNTGTYEWSTTQPVISVKTIPPSPRPY